MKRLRQMVAIPLLSMLLLAPIYTLAQDDDPEKHVTVYTTYGYRLGEDWQIPLRIWVHEAPDFIRDAAARAARGELQGRAGLATLTADQQARFETRTRDFIADSESRERVLFRFDGDADAMEFELVDDWGRPGTDRNGLIEGTFTLPNSVAETLLDAQESQNGWLTFRAVSENHGGVGRVRLIQPTGLSVVSDVDDTIKVTEIPLGEEAVLRNTFFEAFQATPCMGALYSSMDADTTFHYVSGGPWQMYTPLRNFLFSTSAGFPEGSFHMKNVRTNPFESESYRDIWGLLAAGSQQVTYEQKVTQISALLRRFPQRQFVLIGDSGERDPEVFNEIRMHFAEQVSEIRIRDIVNAADEDPQRLQGMTVILPEADPSGQCQLLQPRKTVISN